MDEDLVLDLTVRVHDRGWHYDVTVRNNGTDEVWSMQYQTFIAVNAAISAIRSLSVRAARMP